MPATFSASDADDAPPERAFVLSADLARRLAAHCAATGERPRDVIADAILLLLDETGHVVAAEAS